MSLWLHVSTLMNWDRPPVGIVRVEREYALWLLEHASQAHDVRFCVYDRAAERFVEVPRAQVEERLAVNRELAPPAAPRGELAGWKRAIKNAWYAVRPMLPPQWRDRMVLRARTGYHHLLVARERWRRRLARLLQGRAAADAPAANFARGDQWVSLGADWEYLDQEALYRIKHDVGLQVTLICYDAIPVVLPQLFVDVLSRERFGSYLAELAWCADHVLCISECTRRDFERVMREMGAPVPPTHVIRLGDEIREPKSEAPPAGFDVDGRPFVLYVSTIERRKNHEVLYRAWARMRDNGIVPHRLVFVGMRGWGVNDLMNDLRLDPRVHDDIVVLDRVGDPALAWLYHHAAFTVFPSLYEGWGLPVVESLGWGKFCVASSAASLPEAGGDWVEYIDPWDLPRWVERLSYFMTHPQEVQARNERIAREYQPTAWRDTSAAIHRVAMPGDVYSPGQP
ncbi:glycosyltransferase family 4 protein [Ramlibacter sp. PS4R-6]|uniref:glycosyltransferase family 4 protein n=1 Tax=Ramlibacter sp. PS4R-6 TaxID=3133438 RepID=UPI0030B6007B